MTDRELKQKYAAIKKRMHTIGPVDYKGVRAIMNYYYSLMVKRGIV